MHYIGVLGPLRHTGEELPALPMKTILKKQGASLGKQIPMPLALEHFGVDWTPDKGNVSEESQGSRGSQQDLLPGLKANTI